MDKELTNVLRHNPFDLEQSTILLGYRGSIAHGTRLPKSDPNSIDDTDVIGIAVPPKEYYLGLKTFEQYEKFEGEWDVVIYSIKKMFSLLLKNNPNVLSLLWLPERHYIIKKSAGEKIVSNRNIFSSKLTYNSFCGYGYSQLKRIKTDEKCINNLNLLKIKIENEIKSRGINGNS
jgi:predicted nucleotidyltransferase